jgi:hypothetical protein
MALYKYGSFLKKNEENVFDTISTPGAAAPRSGIYRCEGCHKEVASNEGQPLPPQNHHQHTAAQGNIRWRLAVFAEHNPAT